MMEEKKITPERSILIQSCNSTSETNDLNHKNTTTGNVVPQSLEENTIDENMNHCDNNEESYGTAYDKNNFSKKDDRKSGIHGIHSIEGSSKNNTSPKIGCEINEYNSDEDSLTNQDSISSSDQDSCKIVSVNENKPLDDIVKNGDIQESADSIQDKNKENILSPSKSNDGETEDESESGKSEDEALSDEIKTDENGRQLSAYEIKRLDRIRRNKAYLARLGLEKESKEKGTILSPFSQRMHEAKRRKKIERKKELEQQQQTPDNHNRRSSGRKRKSINYSELREDQKTIPDKVGDGANKNSSRKKKKNSVPWFIFREFKRIERQKRLDVKEAQKNLRLAEVELRYSKKKYKDIEKKLHFVIRRNIIRKEMEERRLGMIDANTKRKDLMPYFVEIRTKKAELFELNRLIRSCIWERMDREAVNDAKKKMEIIDTIDHFPTYVLDARLQLDNLFLKSLPKTPVDLKKRNLILKNLNCKEEKPQISSTKPKSPNKKAVRVEKPPKTSPNAIMSKSLADIPKTINPSNPLVSSKLLPPMPSFLIHTPPSDPQQPRPSNPSPTKTEKKKKKFRNRNVGGPITRDFSDSIQRKWLENDVPLQPSSISHFVPQVGDVVLYYPSAHCDFLQEHPDIRGIKSKSTLRTPLWKRTNESKKKISKEETFQESKPSLKKPSRPWWTDEWVSSIEGKTCCYPIICRVENTVAEFPPDPLEEVEKKKGRKSKNQKKELDENVTTDPAPLLQSSMSRKNGPPINLSVTLRPLTPIVPPELKDLEPQSKKGSYFQDEELPLPPLFSVLTFPSDDAQFLLPFVWAFGLGLSFLKDDLFEFQLDGSKFTGTILSTLHEFCGNHGTNNFDVFNEFLKSGNNSHHLNTLNNILSTQNELGFKSSRRYIPDPDFRKALQMLLYNYHRRRLKIGTEFRPLQDQSNSQMRQTSKPEERNSISTFIGDLSKFIRLMLPRWNGVTVVWNDCSQCHMSSWEIKKHSPSEGYDATGNKDKTSLIPDEIVDSMSIYKRDLIYNLGDDLVLKIERGLKELIKGDDFSPFVRQVSEVNAPGYDLFVPVGMCFKRILRRLKLNLLRVSNHKPNDKCNEKLRCCYYRDVGSIICDINSIFYNCLYYNNPESDIVSLARDVTNRARKMVEKTHSDHLSNLKKKLEHTSKQAIKAQLVASGVMKHDVSGTTTHWDFTSLLHRKPFQLRLNREWNESVVPDITWEPSQTYSGDSIELYNEKENFPKDWFPQSGDMVFYNSQLHGKFVNKHFVSLTSDQRFIPNILPLIVNNPNINRDLTDEKLEETSKSWIIGTIISTESVFPANPSDVTKHKSTFTELTPLVAINLIFHYGQLQGKTYTLYWRPSEFKILNSIDSATTDCNGSTFASDNKICKETKDPEKNTESNTSDFIAGRNDSQYNNLLCQHSFIRPAWIDPPHSILPPHDISLALCNKPTGIPESTLSSIIKCFDILKARSQEGIAPDMLQHSKGFNQLRRPGKSVYEANDSSCTEAEKEKLSFKNEVDDSISLMNLSKVHFIPPWEFRKLEQIVGQKRATRKISLPLNDIASTKATLAEHDMLLPSPNLSLSLVHKRLRSGYYRQLSAVLSDIQEAYVSTITYLIRKCVGKHGITLDSACRIANFCKRNSNELQEEVKKFKINQDDPLMVPLPHLSEMQFNELIEKKDSNFTDVALQKKEIMLVKKILVVRRLYATAIVCVQRTEKAELVFGTSTEEKKTSWVEFRKNVSEWEAESRNIDEILSYTRMDPCVFRKPLRRDEPYPTVKVKIKLGEFEAKDPADKVTTSVKDKQKNSLEISSFTRKPDSNGKDDTLEAEISVPTITCAKDSLKESKRTSEADVTKIHPTNQNSNLFPTQNNALAKNETLSLQIQEKESLHQNQMRKSPVDEPADDDAKSYFNLNDPILLQPSHYVSNLSLCRSLFGRENRFESCAQCRVNNISFLRCRIRKAHSHPDIVWLEELKKKGGVNAIIKRLKKSLAVNPELSDSYVLKEYLRYSSYQTETTPLNQNVAEPLFTKETFLKNTSNKSSHGVVPSSSQNDVSLSIPNVSQVAFRNDIINKKSNEKVTEDGYPLSSRNDTSLTNVIEFPPIKENLINSLSKNVSEASPTKMTLTENLIKNAMNDGEHSSSPNEIPLTVPNASEEKPLKTTLDEQERNVLGTTPKYSMSNDLVPEMHMEVNYIKDSRSKPESTPELQRGDVVKKTNISEESNSTDKNITSEKIGQCTKENEQMLMNKNTPLDKNSESENSFDDEEKLRLEKENFLNVFRMAEQALEMANILLKQAKLDREKEPKLSDEFIRLNFLIDESDGKYMNCVICGLSGSIMCCETKTCPTVAHAHCVGLRQVPEGEWFCPKCSHHKGNGNVNDHTHTLIKSAENEIGSDTNSITTGALINLLNKLKHLRVKDSIGNEKRKDCNGPCGKPQTNEGKETEEKSNEEKSNEEKSNEEKSNEEKSNEEKMNGKVEEIFENKNSGHTPNLEKDKNPESIITMYAIGTKIVKSFNHVDFIGKIMAVPSPDFPYYRVRYVDGDEEDMSLNELRNHMNSNSTENSKKKLVSTDLAQDKTILRNNLNHPPKRKRGRPRKYPVDETKSNKKLKLEVRNEPISDKQSSMKTETKGSSLSQSRRDPNVTFPVQRKRGRPRKSERMNEVMSLSCISPDNENSNSNSSTRRDTSPLSSVSIDVEKTIVRKNTDMKGERNNVRPRRSRRTLSLHKNYNEQGESEESPGRRNIRRSNRLGHETSKLHRRSDKEISSQDMNQRTLLLDKYFDSKSMRRNTKRNGGLYEMFDSLD